MRKFILALFSLAALFATTERASAQDAYPSKPIHLVVVYPAGGGNDLFARVLGQKLSAEVGQPVVIENRVGAQGVVGSQFVSRSNPDGYTLMVGGLHLVVGPIVQKTATLDPIKDFTPVMNLARAPLVIAASPGFSAGNARDMVSIAKARPEQISYVAGSAPYTLNMELMSSMANIKLFKVPYKGTTESFGDLVSGRVDLIMESVGSMLPHIATGKLKALAVTTKERHPKLPNVPTLAESGLAGYDESIWLGLMGPPGMDASVVEKLNAVLSKLMQNEDVRKTLDSIGYEPAPAVSVEFKKLIWQTQDKYRRVADVAGIKPE